ncbi:MAG: hypothetical protein ACK4KU_14670 [Acinetobacter sp.]|uniref:hypothetical protein n=1 Tax=Acinetobacter sp. TaxID=472 RepID=UPI00391D19F3
MSQLIKDFVSVLKETLPTATIRPALGKNYKFPAVVYSVRNGMRTLFYKDSFGLKDTEVTITVYSKSYDEIQSLKEQIVNTFHGFSGELASSNVSKIEIANIFDGFDDALEEVHRATFVINITD